MDIRKHLAHEVIQNRNMQGRHIGAARGYFLHGTAVSAADCGAACLEGIPRIAASDRT